MKKVGLSQNFRWTFILSFLLLFITNSFAEGRHVYVQPFKVDEYGLKDRLESGYEVLYSMLKATFIFKDFNIYFKYCGRVNAFSNPRDGSITICNELVVKLVNNGHINALPWIFFHEAGHSLLRLWGYPLWDNEDAADEFATVILLMGGNSGKQIISDTIKEWQTHPSWFESFRKLFKNDRHTISIQRARNIATWVRNSESLKKRWFNLMVPNMQTGLLEQTIQNPEPWMDTELIGKELKRRIVSPSLAAGITEESTKLTLEKLKNSEYVVGREKIKLIDGKYEQGTSVSNFFSVWLGEVAFGDLNGDGKEDAAVILLSSGGGSGFFCELAAVINKNGNPYHVTSVQLGNGVQIKSIFIISGEIIINMLTHGPKDPMCCPTVKTKANYRLKDGKLIKK